MDFDLRSNWRSAHRVLLAVFLVVFPCQDLTTAIKVTVPHTVYKCPEGQSVSLICSISGTLRDMHDHVGRLWAYSQHRNQSCSEKMHIRNITEKELHSRHAQSYGVILSSDHKGNFHLTLKNLTQQDQGGYCCYILDIKDEHGKHHLLQQAHGFMELEVFKASNVSKASQSCTYYPLATADNANVAAAMATVGCIIGILCLPLILVLVYKQRQSTVSRRRAHELVRMDSDARGIENPVFDVVHGAGQGSESRPRPIHLGRQHSESGRHLLSEPNTPLSPPGLGDCFFPTLETIPDSSELVKV